MNTLFKIGRESKRPQHSIFGRCLSARLSALSAPKMAQDAASILNAGIVLCTTLFFGFTAFAQETPKDSTKVNTLSEVLVSAVRVDTKTPVSFSNLDKKEIETRNLGQDIPILMNFLPSVVTTSDAGNGFGYTGIRVRGSDATRVNVTINGIPYNDSESHGTFWVNMPDFASSIESLQLQRGVGTSTNGSGAFCASLNMLTDDYATKAGGEISNSFGSFNTRKHTVKFTTGLLSDRFELAGRLSNIHSQGFIDRAESDLKSYFLQGNYVGESTFIKALVFGGTEKTYQSWYGLEDVEKLRSDRTYNVAGMYTDALGNRRFYDNQTDNYWQDHYQLHWNEKIAANWHTNLALHYTKGKGYYENFEAGAAYEDFGLIPTNAQTKTDLVNQKWLDNDFYGTTFSINYTKHSLEVIFGGGFNIYEGDHFGKVIWTQQGAQNLLGDKYYDNSAIKRDGNLFAKANYQLNSRIGFYGDLQYRRVSYKADGVQPVFVEDVFEFFNPKAGLNFKINETNSLYFSYARANREPNRDDYENGSPRPERLDDFELGWRYVSQKMKWNINGYYMNYQDQLVLTGALNDVGSPIRANSGKSYRLGIEVDATFALHKKWTLQPNVTLSQSKNQNFYFNRDGGLQQLGNTNIAFSPEIIAGNRLVFAPVKNLQFALLSKFVGEQFMGNIDSETSKLASYFTNDINVSYEFLPKKIFRSILVSALVNNVFDTQYESNGYFYTYDDDYSNPGTIKTIEGAGFYPQAGINFLVGLTLKF